MFQRYLDLAFYSHVSIPSPPCIVESVGGATETKKYIRQQYLVPLLYETPPPACNIIAKDQIVSLSLSEDALSAPTRSVVTLRSFNNRDLPVAFMANDARNSINMSNPENSDIIAASVTSLLSSEELTRGVVAHVDSISASAASSAKTDDIEKYADAKARYSYCVNRLSASRMNVQCHFMPYVMPGFTAAFEDAAGGMFGYVEAVFHSLDCHGSFSTTLAVSNVRGLRKRVGVQYHPPYPLWLNAKYTETEVDGTYESYYGERTMAV
jgi:hypothetical protein